MGHGDTLYALEPARGAVFDPDHRYVRSLAMGRSFMTQYALPADSGRILVNAALTRPESVGLPLHILATNGAVEYSFGATPGEVIRPDKPIDVVRWLTPGPTAQTVWAVPVNRYEISLWDVSNGRRLSVLIGELPWRPSNDTTPARPYYESRPRGAIAALGRDSLGLLYVYSHVSDPQWSPDLRLKNQELIDLFNRRDRSRFYDTVIDVIDPQTGSLVTTIRHPEALNGWAASTDGMYVFSRWEDEVGMIRLDVWRVRLKIRP
jgi:hypothetical protein